MRQQKVVNMLGFRSHLICLFILVGFNLTLADEQDKDSARLTELDGHVLISSDLKDKPESVFLQLKQYLQDKRETDVEDLRIEGLGFLTVQQLVGACGSVEGNCDITDLGSLDGKLYFSGGYETGSDWTQYANYCRDQWLAKCDPSDAVIKRIGVLFTRDEWSTTKELVDLVLREPPEKKDPHAVDIHYRYPQGVLKFMRSKDGNLDDILQLKKDKRNLFRKSFDQFVKPVCEQVVSSLKYVVQGLKWAHNNVIPTEELSPTVENALKIFRICLKISIAEEELVGLSYDIFTSKKKSLMSKLKDKTRSGLGVKD